LKKLILALFAFAVLLALPGVAAAGPNGDPDRDGVDTRNEHREGTDPQRRDSDRDGRSDGREDADHDGLDNATEDATGNDPADRDSDDDGIRDDREGAGTVASFADGTLTVRLAGGASAGAVGTVDELTDLSCPTESSYEQEQAGRGTPKAYRHAKKRPKGHGGRHASHAHRANAAQAPDDDGDWTGDEGDDPFGDGDVGDDEDWSDDPSEDDGDWDDGDDGDADLDAGGDATGACVALLVPGARVHASEVDSDEDGSYFVSIELVR
jgi:hypothetical protein